VGARNKESSSWKTSSPCQRRPHDYPDDGSYADKGFVTDKLRQLIENGTRIDLVLAIGSHSHDASCRRDDRKERIRTIVSLNPIMIDGTGMCGGCRVLVDWQSEFACVDGPSSMPIAWTSGVLVQRNAMYRSAEHESPNNFSAKLWRLDRSNLRTRAQPAPCKEAGR